MQDTFSEPKEKDPSVAEILKQVDVQDKQKKILQEKLDESSEKAQSAQSQSQPGGEDMTITEHIALVKKQTTDIETNFVKEEKEKNAKEAQEKIKTDKETKEAQKHAKENQAKK